VKVEGFSSKLARAQVARPWLFLGGAALLTLVMGVLASGLEFDSSYYALLPEGMKEPEAANEVRERTGGTRQLVVAIKGRNAESRLEFGRKLVEKVRKIEQVRYADVEFPMEFFEEHGLWMLELGTLDRLLPALEEAIRIAKYQANPLAIHLDEEEEERELEEAWQKVDDIVGEETEDLPYDPVFTSKDDRYTFLLVIPSIKIMDLEGGEILFESIERAAQELDPEAHGVSVQLAGMMKVFHEQHETMLRDLRNASLLALVFGVLIVAIFTRKPTSPLIVGAGLISGITWTFGLARLLVDHLNVITGFLVAVLIGLGIDFSIHILIRYRQDRRLGGLNPEQAVHSAVVGTLPPALTSALTTTGAFFSCMIAEFRGFSEFGLIAGIGVILTLVSSFLVLPPLLYILDRRVGAVETSSTGVEVDRRAAPKLRWLAFVLVIASLAWAAYGGWFVRDIPFRNNFKELRGISRATEFFDYVSENLGFGFNPAVVLVGSVHDARKVEAAALEARDRRLKAGVRSRIDTVFSIAKLLPEDVEEHRVRIEKFRKLLSDPKLDRAEKKGGKRAEDLKLARKMVKTEPWSPDDIPEPFLQRLVTLDRKDFLVFIWPDEHNDSDLQCLAWEKELDEIAARIESKGVKYTMADETIMSAWIYRLIVEDSPKMLLLATVVVLLLILMDFRKLRRLALMATTLGVGMLGFMGAVHALGMELNMFNLIVVPCVIGIGVDNVVHIYHRYLTEGPGSVLFVVRRTGMAAMLASLTTGVGFGSSLISHHLGLKSLGSLAIVGISATLLTAVVFFPCLLAVLESLKNHRR
jgi:predicted RND superfamily exporter protein